MGQNRNWPSVDLVGGGKDQEILVSRCGESKARQK